MKKHILRTAMTVLGFGIAVGQANAATLINGNNGLTDQIHSAGNQAASTLVFGKTQISNDSISFTSTSKLGINGNGYAQINDGAANDGEILDNLNLFLTSNPNGFSAVEFSIEYASQVLRQKGDGFLTVTVDFLGGGSQSFAPIQFSNPALKDFQIMGSGNEVFTALRLNSNIEFSMVKQNDIQIASAVVPEPATWALLIAGFGLVGGTMRRRKPAVVTA